MVGGAYIAADDMRITLESQVAPDTKNANTSNHSQRHLGLPMRLVKLPTAGALNSERPRLGTDVRPVEHDLIPVVGRVTWLHGRRRPREG